MRYEITVYYGGEIDDEVWYAENLKDAKRVASRGEHAEIIDKRKNKIIEL